MSWKIKLGISFAIMMIILGVLYTYPPESDNIRETHGGKDRPYYFRLELRQWEIVVYDLNQIEDLVFDGVSTERAFSLSKYTGNLGTLEKGSRVYFQVYSLDVQHGVSISDLDFTIAITDITDDIDSTIPKYFDFTLPEKDISLEVKCSTYCGLGHSGMLIKMNVGSGEVNLGPMVFRIVIVVIGIIAILFTNLILNSDSRKVFVIEEIGERVSNKKRRNYIIYDISSLSPKELVTLRFQPSDVYRIGRKLEIIKAKSLIEAIERVKHDSISANWKIQNNLI